MKRSVWGWSRYSGGEYRETTEKKKGRMLIVDPGLLSRFQIGAYDQQIWEKSVEQREIKVRRFWARFCFGRPFPFSLLCFAHFRFVSLSFLLLLSFLLPLFLFFNSFLFDRGGGALARLSSLHLHLHPFFFIIRCFPPLQFISLVSTRQGGRPSRRPGSARRLARSSVLPRRGSGRAIPLRAVTSASPSKREYGLTAPQTASAVTRYRDVF